MRKTHIALAAIMSAAIGLDSDSNQLRELADAHDKFVSDLGEGKAVSEEEFFEFYQSSFNSDWELYID